MAGSPGLGKTEFSKRYLPEILAGFNEELQKINSGLNLNIDSLLIRIYVDGIREALPQYQKTDPL